MKKNNKKLILVILTFICLLVPSVSAKSCYEYKKKNNCNKDNSCTWVSSKCRVNTCTSLSKKLCSKNTDKSKKACKYNADKKECCPNGNCENGIQNTLNVDNNQINNSLNNSNSNSTSTSNSKNDISGCAVFGKKTTALIRWALYLIRIGGPILVIALGATDFLKILISGEEKTYKEAGVKFIKRLIALVVLLLLPYILFFILTISGILSQYGISNNDIFCVLKL